MGFFSELKKQRIKEREAFKVAKKQALKEARVERALARKRKSAAKIEKAKMRAIMSVKNPLHKRVLKGTGKVFSKTYSEVSKGLAKEIAKGSAQKKKYVEKPKENMSFPKVNTNTLITLKTNKSKKNDYFGGLI